MCPAGCFYGLDKQLVIDPEKCTDCAACEPECPIGAIFFEDDLPSEYQDAIEFNAKEVARLREEGISPINLSSI
uniref:Ferredoxin n=1 Tax=Candidatus Kentrum sp. FM TaxID=2126340 RepID=A0A450SZI1_9GAMM|nr:MAG: ferredoxin [Candidatus Kentron sp. FM]VFJ59617.1 MAG: ferredoxin [Candidatus Kentron sp. FM]VFK12262.1 MAG: ferredoxin [Candidatus Kentron sp. FM]